MENKKKIEQLKKIESLDTQLTKTISKIDKINQPIKISKKHLSILMLIPLGVSLVLTAIITFLAIDPYHWYTIDYDTYLVERKAKIENKFKSYVIPTEFVLERNKNKTKDLIDEIKKKPYLEELFKSIDEKFNPDTKLNIYRSSLYELKDEEVLKDNNYQLKFDFNDYDFNAKIAITIKVKINPF